MHIKDSPVKGYKTDFAGFQLDTSRIELHSAHTREIHLPYSGPLPDCRHAAGDQRHFVPVLLPVQGQQFLSHELGLWPHSILAGELPKQLYPLEAVRRRGSRR